MLGITEIDNKHYYFDYKLIRHGPFDTVEELHEAISKEAERLRNELQQEGNGSLRES